MNFVFMFGVPLFWGGSAQEGVVFIICLILTRRLLPNVTH